MIIHGEIVSSYHYKPIDQGLDYSPLMVESKEEALVKEERQPEAIPVVVPPFNIPPATDNNLSGLVFLCFTPPPLRECLRGLYIVLFRLRLSI
jgi:hypothetical protein